MNEEMSFFYWFIIAAPVHVKKEEREKLKNLFEETFFIHDLRKILQVSKLYETRIPDLYINTTAEKNTRIL